MSLDGFIPCAVRRLSGMAVELYSGIVLPRLGLNLCEGKAACLADKQHGTLDRIACASITIVRPNGGNVNDHPLTDRISRRFLIHGYASILSHEILDMKSPRKNALSRALGYPKSLKMGAEVARKIPKSNVICLLIGAK